MGAVSHKSELHFFQCVIIKIGFISVIINFQFIAKFIMCHNV